MAYWVSLALLKTKDVTISHTKRKVYTVKLRSLEVVGAIFTSQNHTKCESKMSTQQGLDYKRQTQNRNVDSADVFYSTGFK